MLENYIMYVLFLSKVGKSKIQELEKYVGQVDK